MSSLATREQRSLAQREANAAAVAAGHPMPYPNPWDSWDPTKLNPADYGPGGPSFADEVGRAHAFRSRWRRRACRRHEL